MTSDVVPATEGDRRWSKHFVQWSDGDAAVAAAAGAIAHYNVSCSAYRDCCLCSSNINGAELSRGGDDITQYH